VIVLRKLRLESTMQKLRQFYYAMVGVYIGVSSPGQSWCWHMACIVVPSDIFCQVSQCRAVSATCTSWCLVAVCWEREHAVQSTLFNPRQMLRTALGVFLVVLNSWRALPEKLVPAKLQSCPLESTHNRPSGSLCTCCVEVLVTASEIRRHFMMAIL
jgi:hypothetical protein